jgi:hypothetical protein
LGDLLQIETIPLRENSTAEEKIVGDLLQIQTIPLRENSTAKERGGETCGRLKPFL